MYTKLSARRYRTKNIKLMKMLANNFKSFDDLVFENRNQNYGAYVIRKSYHDNMLRALLFSSVVVGIFLFLVTRPAGAVEPPKIDKDDSVKIIDVVVPPEVKKVEPDNPQKKVTPAESQTVPDYSSNGELQKLDKKFDPDKAIGPIDQDGEKRPLDSLDIIGIEGTDTTGSYKPVKTMEPLRIVQNMPTFPGGEPAMMKFIAAQAHKNNQWADMGLTGTVYVQFVVAADGTISNVEAVRGPYDVLKKVAVNAVKSMPNWNPGMQDGHAVPVILAVPISFKQ